MKEIREFLSTILTAKSITKNIREEALLLRDTIDLAEKVKTTKKVGLITSNTTVRYSGRFKGENNVVLQLAELNKCHYKAKGIAPLPGKIPFIKALRLHFQINLIEAKQLSEWLHSNGILYYQQVYCIISKECKNY